MQQVTRSDHNDLAFLVLTLPEELVGRIQSWQKRFAPHYRSNSPLHMTLVPPFQLDRNELEAIKESLSPLSEILPCNFTLAQPAMFHHDIMVLECKSQEAAGLAAAAKSIMAPFILGREGYPFSAHITISRNSGSKQNSRLMNEAAKLVDETIWSAGTVTLLSRSGTNKEYRPLFSLSNS